MEEEKKETTTPTADAKDVEENKAMAIIAYLWILFLVPLLTKKDSPFAQFHAKQGLVLFVFELIINILWIIPIIGWIVAAVGQVAALIFLIMGIMNAVNGKMQELPLIGQFGKKINF